MKSFDLARAVCREASAELDGKPGLARAIASNKTVAAVVNLARSDRQHAAVTCQWDADPHALGAGTVTVDLTTGATRSPQRSDYITKSTAIAPGGNCPRWLNFLMEVTDGNTDLQEYLQRIAGYCLTGITSAHALFFLYGTGRNGKGVFLNTLHGVYGDYATTAAMETFVATDSDHHPTDLADLRGARLVIAQETEQGRRWAEAKIKRMTGGDPIKARFMRQDFFEYTPQFKLVIAGNHKPSLVSVDEAIRARFNLVPFTVTIPETKRDPELAEKLRPEWPGILQWAIDGCLEWQRIGLKPPKIVREATEAYLLDEDTFLKWVDECCVTGTQYFGIGAHLWNSWKPWAERYNENPGNRKTFAEAMIAHGYPADKSQRVRGYSGVNLRPELRPRECSLPDDC
jgi:putative DNA primase/helicase